MSTRGVFISLEGIDGSGKTCVKDIILRQLAGWEVLNIREPGGTATSEKIRAILLDCQNEGIKPLTEAFLYAAARAQLVEEVIRPALAAGKVIIADRFLDSTIAYQGYGRGLERQMLTELNRLCTSGLKPDLTLLLDVDPEEGLRRRGGELPDRLEKEGLDFQRRVREGYLQIARAEPERMRVINAGRSLSEVAGEAVMIVRERLRESGIS
jgi:dTMP kinase